MKVMPVMGSQTYRKQGFTENALSQDALIKIISDLTQDGTRLHANQVLKGLHLKYPDSYHLCDLLRIADYYSPPSAARIRTLFQIPLPKRPYSDLIDIKKGSNIC